MYFITDAGKSAIKSLPDGSKRRILEYLKSNRSASFDELKTIGEDWAIHKLKRLGLIRKEEEACG